MIISITGGSGSGKSAFAEDLVVSQRDSEERIYIATMFPFGEESQLKIRRHRQMRASKGFVTVECYTKLKEIKVQRKSCVLLECISNLTANELYWKEGAKEHTVTQVLEGIRSLKEQAKHVFIVTNEVFSDGLEYSKETMQYMRILGEINRRLAGESDVVIEVVYGIPIVLKGENLYEAVI
jgi:adenosylcobinamide kinase/adenosylcobinamide-phosphate guanylyltransferase